MGHRARRAVVVAVVSCLVPGAGGVAAVPRTTSGIRLTSEVVLSGSRSASVDVVLSRPVTLGPGDLFDPPKSAFESSRIGAGYVLMNVDQAFDPPVLVGLRAPQGQRSRAIQLPIGKDPQGNQVLVTLRLPAGRYRLYLVTDGLATVRFRLPGAPSGRTTLAPSRPEAVATRRMDAIPSERRVGDVFGDARTLTAEQTLVVQTVTGKLVFAPAGYESYWCFYDGAPVAGYLPHCAGARQGTGVGIRMPLTEFDYSGLGAFVNVDAGNRAVSKSLEAYGQLAELSSYVMWIPMPLGKPAAPQRPAPVALDNLASGGGGAGSGGTRTSSGS